MGPSAPEQMTRQVFWTQFPAASLSDVDWADHQQAHKAVMRLFARNLDGPADRRRDTAGILHRIDSVNGEPTILVQSLVQPELVPPLSRSIAVKGSSWTVEAGEKVAFRVAVNPIRRTTRFYTDPGRTKPAETAPRLPDGRRDRSASRQTASVVPADELHAWLAAKLDGALTNIEIINHFRDETRSGKAKLVVDTFDGLAQAADPARLDELRLQGVGRARAYGCGLLTVTHLH